jgi:flagellar assembly protein FliH
MSLAILKSPTMIDRRLSLGAEMGSGMPLAIEVNPNAALESQLRAELEAEYAARLESLKDEAREQGYKAGFASGHEDGQTTALDAFRKKQALLEQALARADAQVHDWLQSVNDQAMQIAQEAITLFVGEHALNVTVLQQIIQRVTSGLRDVDVLAVRLFPTECSMLRSALKQAQGDSGSNRLLERLVEDASLEAGGVVIDTPRGEYRATLDVQLRKLMAILNQRRSDSLSSTHTLHQQALRA